MQASPALPHMPLEVPGRQTPPLPQHPLGHEMPSHMQAPLTQCLPAAQGAAVPHKQAPPVEQLSAPIGSQGTHVPPIVPQAAIDRGMHAPFAQQPSAQLAAEHTQAPFTHALPAAHCGLAPQRQAPVTGSQRSASVALQVMQVAPPTPQVAATGV